MDKTYRVTISLQEPEAVALSRLARVEHRDMRTQAHHILYKQLVTLGLLPSLEISDELDKPLVKVVS